MARRVTPLHLPSGNAWRRTADRMRALVTSTTPVATKEEAGADPEITHALRVLDVAMRLSDMLLSTGASANDVALTVRRVTRAYGLHGIEADVTFTSISLSWVRVGQEPLTTLRVVRARTVDYARLQRAYDLAYGIETGRIEIDEAEREVRAIRRMPHRYRPWVVIASSGVLAVGVCLLFGASWIVSAFAFVASCLVHMSLMWLGSKALPWFFCQAVGAAIPTAAAIFITWMQSQGHLTEVRPSLVVTAGIVLLLAGMSTVGAAQDSIDGYYVTASARAFEVMMLTLGIVAGLLAMIRVGKTIGITLVINANGPTLGPLSGQLLGAMLIGGAFAVGCLAGPRTAALCSLMGLTGWVCYLIGAKLFFGPVGASAIAAFVAATIAVLISPKLKVPSLALITAAQAPLMPGSMLYRGVLSMTESGPSADVMGGAMLLLSAAGIGLALAAGTSLGVFFARPLPDRARRIRRRGH